MFWPSRCAPRTEILLPICRKSRTLADMPQRMWPRQETPEPTLAQYLSDMEEAMVTKSSTEIAEPMRVMLLKDMEEPSVT